MNNLKLLFIHSAGRQKGSKSSTPLLNYLKEQLSDSIEIVHPKMPFPEAPESSLWLDRIDSEIHRHDCDWILVGHSLGGSVLLKYLSERLLENNIRGLFLIASPYWGADENWQWDDFELDELFHLKLPAIREIHLYHSIDDEVVPATHMEVYASRFYDPKVRFFKGQNHYFAKPFPQLLEDIRTCFFNEMAMNIK